MRRRGVYIWDRWNRMLHILKILFYINIYMDTKYICLVLLILLVTIIVIVTYSKQIVDYVEEKFQDCPTIEDVRNLYLDQTKRNHEGSYKLYDGKNCLESCPKGSFINTNNLYKCEECGIGKYNDDINNFRCKPCGTDKDNLRKLTFKTGTKEFEDCKSKTDIENKLKSDLNKSQLDPFYNMILDNIMSVDHTLKTDDIIDKSKKLILDKALQTKNLENELKSLESQLSEKYPSLKF
jgi:hypothetical protein